MSVLIQGRWHVCLALSPVEPYISEIKVVIVNREVLQVDRRTGAVGEACIEW